MRRTLVSGRGAVAIGATIAAIGLAVLPAAAAPSLFGGDIDPDAVNRHLIALQRIADQNDGTRATGTPGYEASVGYVAGKLRDAGFDVTTPEFSYQQYFNDKTELAVDGAPVEASALVYSTSTPQGGLTAALSLAKVDDTPGCEASDYDGLNVTGTVVLIKRGACTFADKQRIAAEHGASAAIIYNNVDGALNGTLGSPDVAKIPTAGVSKQAGEALAAKPGAQVKLDIQGRLQNITAHNVVAQTKTGRADNVVMAGAHLDSVPQGPGINDDGTGTAGLLETALRMGPKPKTNNAMRFAFWGAEEAGLVGSTKYVQGLSSDQQLDIALYLNFDMIGSPNAGYFAFDGDNSDNVGAGPGPQGSAQIEKDFVAAMDKQGVQVEGTDFDGRSDYGGFINVGIPAGGLFTGAEGIKTEQQAVKWGGVAGAPYDANYHKAGDNLTNVDRVALLRNVRAMAAVVAEYGKSTETVNGVSGREKRKQSRMEESAKMAQSRSVAGETHDGAHACMPDER